MNKSIIIDDSGIRYLSGGTAGNYISCVCNTTAEACRSFFHIPSVNREPRKKLNRHARRKAEALARRRN